MKILFLNLYFPPDTSATAKIAASYADALSVHHKVTVLCGRPSYDPSERRSWQLWRNELQGNVSVIRVGSTDYPRFQMNRRIFNYLSYVALAVLRGLFLPCDAIFAMTDPPFNGIVAALVAALKGKPLIYNVQDMYPDMAVGGSLVKPGLLVRIWEKLHRLALRRATRVIAIGDDMRMRLISKNVDPQKIVVIRTGVETKNAAPSVTPDPQVTRAIRGAFTFVLLHAGNLGFYGAWDNLIAAMRLVAEQDSGVGLVFVGDGAQREELVAAADGCSNVAFLPFFPAESIPSVLAAADVHVITVKRGLEGVVVPSKMYGILAAGKPVLTVAPEGTDAATLGNQQGWGSTADPDVPEAIAKAVLTLAGDAPRLHKMGIASLAAVLQYDRDRQLDRFALLFADKGAN